MTPYTRFWDPQVGFSIPGAERARAVVPESSTRSGSWGICSKASAERI